jgi:antitoxin (DNA-binding transcriptional repressor) of toxin-antitoxin stability system
MKLTATRLRSELYQVLDRVVATGESVEIERGGATVVIQVSAKRKAAKPKVRTSNPDLVIGDADDLVHFDWSKHWKPFL